MPRGDGGREQDRDGDHHRKATASLAVALANPLIPPVDLAPRPRDAGARAVEAERKRLGLSWEKILKS
jgi:hypothetical protein